MKRIDILNLVKGLENSKEIVDAILDMHNEELTEAKKKNVDLSAYVEKTKYDELEKQLTKFKDYDELVKFKEETIITKTKEEKQKAFVDLLTKNKASEKALKLLAKAVDVNALELDENKSIVGGDDIVNNLKKEYEDFFVKVEQKTTNPIQAGKTGNEQTITKEQFKAMNYQQKNELYNNNKELYEQLSK